MKINSLIVLAITAFILNSCKTVLDYSDVRFIANKITFDTIQRNPAIQIQYQTTRSPYLDSLKKLYPLDDVLTECKSDMERVLQVLNWTHSRWDHVGTNAPRKNDAISILDEAEKGGQFPCFAYAIVLRDQLTALGYQARTIYLKTKNAKNSKYPPGHVATEVYLKDVEKWVFLDGQFNVMPVLDNILLNAVEFQKAITDKAEGLMLLNLKKELKKEHYFSFIYSYLFYFDTALDNRYDPENNYTVDGKTAIMLVPHDSKNLTEVKFWNIDVNYCVYTNSVLDFYAKPEQ